MDKSKRIRAQGVSGCCWYKLGKKGIPKREEIPIKTKSDFKSFSIRRS